MTRKGVPRKIQKESSIYAKGTEKLSLTNPYIFATCLCKPLVFQTWTIVSKRIQV